ncbi:MAG TPA: NTP transferase domain-containing protein [Thermoanaerobaculia bacterium]|nr:NTP transferase domain-containing protein [Thermoanaerobaculia bacterium]
MKLVVLAAGLGVRLRQESGPHPKSLLEVGGISIFDRLLELADLLGLEPVVATRPEFVADFRRPGVEVLVVENTPHMLVTLADACRRLPPGPLCWVGADMLFTDPAPLKELVEAHLAGDSFCSFCWCRTDRFKAKLELAPELAVTVTREGRFERSIPNFMAHAARVARWLPGGWEDPRGSFPQRAIERGERIDFREYAAPVFEIDTPADLEEARRYFARCA